MKLTTPVPVPISKQPFDYSHKALFLGSCFAVNIGERMGYYGFNTVVNPFGIIFNPVSLQLLIERSILDQPFTTSDVQEKFSYLAHSDCNGATTEHTVSNLNQAAAILKKSLRASSHIYITLGTAWVYEINDSLQIVANCHKQPQYLFKKRILETTEIINSLNAITASIITLNPMVKLCYTLSPVRHFKDGAVQNMQSKSRLHDAIQSHVSVNNITYFPAYEIVMDELRDYRFYGSDMLHLNETGIDFVWSRFRESEIATSTVSIMNQVKKYRKLASHRPTDLMAHELHVEQLKNKLTLKHPEIVW